MRSLNALIGRTITAHRGRSVLTLLSIASGVAMVLAAAIVGQAASRQAERLSESERVMGNVVLVQIGLAVVGLIILFAAGFVILNAFAMSVTGRARELGALRALGMTRGLRRDGVMRLVLGEAALLGLAGTAVGLAAGLGLAWGVMQAMGTLEGAPLAVPAWGPAVAVCMGLGVTLVAAFQPAWSAGRVSPLAAARTDGAGDAGRPTRLGATGLLPRAGGALLGLALVGSVTYGLAGRPDVWAAQAAVLPAQALMMLATALLLPWLVGPAAALCRPLLTRLLGTSGRLAADNLARNRARTALTAGGLTAGLVVIVASSGLMTAGLKGGIVRIRSAVNEDSFIAGDLPEMVASQQLTVDNFFQFIAAADLGYDLDAVLCDLEPLVASGSLQVIRYRFQAIPAELSAIPGAPGLCADPELYLDIGNFDFFQGDAATARAWMARGRAVLLMPIAADRLGVGVGDEVPVRTPRGTFPYTVAGIGGGGMMMPVLAYADCEADFRVTSPSFLGLVVPGDDPERTAAVLAQVAQVVAPHDGVVLLDLHASLDPVVEMVTRLEVLLDGLLLLAVVVAALGVVNTVVINVAERRREIGLLRAVGATQRQVRQAIVAEAAVVGLLAAVVAGALGLLMLLTWGAVVLPNGTESVGVRADPETVRLTVGAGLGDWAAAAAVALAFGPLVAGLAAYVPARRAAAADVVAATRSEQISL
ncbi:MAG: FtsX-like permease family protein [Anaerolineae bacterium]|nr:FtsX-like permease family protein [Anaerolineae bacterium]